MFEFRTLQLTNPELAEYMRNLMWNPHTQAPRNIGDSNNAPLFEGGREALLSRGVSYYDPFAVTPADEETDYDYDQENRLVHVSMPTDIEVMFSYDGVGRRLIKEVVDDTGDDTVTTTWKYHYVKGQITTIEIDAIEDDGETQTAVRDETLHIHFGPNALPISFEWERYDYDTSTTLTDTYYYHFDVHGNLLKITDDSATTKISYDYDVLGEISSVTNPDGITNPFAWGGSSQMIYDDIIGMYSNQAGFYRTDVGTLLGGGAPVFTNPTSGHVVNKITTTNTSSKQMKSNRFKVLNDLPGLIPNIEPVTTTVGLIIGVVGCLASLTSLVMGIWPGSSKADARNMAEHLQKGTFSPRWGYAPDPDGFRGISYQEVGMEINSSGLNNLINKYGTSPVGDDKYMTKNDWDNSGIQIYGNPGAYMLTGAYAGWVSELGLKMAKDLVGVGDTEGGGSVIYSTGNVNQGDLAAVIADSAAQFDADFGGAGAFGAHNSKRELFYKQLKNDIESDPRFNMNGDSEKEFADTFQQTFGDLPDTDGDGYPDVADTDDDNDGVGDAVDDDDDNDGCLDRDEKDGNIGGETGDLTGEGRGNGIADKADIVKPDDPDYDPGYTGGNDDG